MQVFPSPCELQLFKPRQPQLASWICSVRAVAFAFEFQVSDGSEEQALKSPFKAAVRIKAGWLLNGFPNLSHYSGKVGTKIFRTFIFKMLLWEVSHTRWHIAAWMRFNRNFSIRWQMSSPVNCVFANAPGNSQWSDLSKGNFIVLWFALFCFHLFWWQYCPVFQMSVPWSMRLLFRCTFCPRAWPTSCASTGSSQSSNWSIKKSVMSSWRLRRSWERETEFSWGPRCLTIQKGRHADQLTMQVVEHSCSETPTSLLSTWPLPCDFAGPRRCVSCQQDHRKSLPELQPVRRWRCEGAGTAAGWWLWGCGTRMTG